MSWLARIIRSLRSETSDDEVSTELQLHVDLETQDLIAQGIEPGEARRRAKLALGGFESTRVQVRDTRMVGWVRAAADEFRGALRRVRGTPWLSGAAVATFALGLGVCLAVFSSVDRLLFRTLPYPEAARVVAIRPCGEDGVCAATIPSVIAWRGRESLHTVGPMAVAAVTASVVLSPEVDEPPLSLITTTANLLRVLQVRPILGRDMTDDDERGGSRVSLLSYQTWHARFGGSEEVLERRIGRTGSVRIIGVLPRDFIPPTLAALQPDWDGLILDAPDGFASIGQNGRVMAPIARLAPGATIEQARAEITALAAALEPETRGPSGTGSSGPAGHIEVQPVDRAVFDFADLPSYAWLVVATASIIFLMACVNLTTLLLARARRTARNGAIRVALGASRLRIVAGGLADALLLCGSGLVCAWAAFTLTRRTLSQVVPPVFARYAAGSIDSRLLLFGALATVACAVLAGIWPGLQLARPDVMTVLQNEDRRLRVVRLHGGRLFLVVEAALGAFLLVAAFTTIQSFRALVGQDLGFSAQDLYHVRPRGRAASVADYQQIVEALASAPGVAGVAGGDSLIGDGTGAMRGFSLGEVKGPRYEVTGGFFAATGGRVLAGREFGSDAGVRSILLNRSAAAALFPHEPLSSVVGRPIELGDEPARTIVGIVADVRTSPTRQGQPALYFPLGTHPRVSGGVLVRMRPGIEPPVPDIRGRIRNVLGDGTSSVASITDFLEPSFTDPRFKAVLLGTFGVCALLLAAAGLYALTVFEVGLRTHEVAIRLALGASSRRIRLTVLGAALLPVVTGMAAGLVAAWWAAQYVGAKLPFVNGREMGTYVLCAMALLVVACVAAWLPARRASRTDPAVVLRSI